MSSFFNKLARLVPTPLASVAFVLSAQAALSCSFVQFVLPGEGRTHKGAGLWSYEWWDAGAGRYACRAYPHDVLDVDARWTAARWFGALTPILGGVAAANAVVRATRAAWRLRRSPTASSGPRRGVAVGGAVGRAEGTVYLLCCACSSLTLLFLKGNACQHNTIFNLVRNHECRLSTGAECVYAAMVLYFLAASLLIINEETVAEGDHRSDEVGGETGTVREDNDERREPLIQDVIFECEQSTYSRQDGEVC